VVNKMIARAQEMCDADGKVRWVNFTSLGWRIELTECTTLSIKITSRTVSADVA
jgi:hypothetical protein